MSCDAGSGPGTTSTPGAGGGGWVVGGDVVDVAKVLAEQARLDQVAAGIKVSTQP
jgi:hypothetical protein